MENRSQMINAALHELAFNGGLLGRGFWLYVWEITPPQGAKLYYVGRTGDNSSINAQSPFNRMGQHLGFAENSNMLRRHLFAYKLQPEICLFRLVAHGPVLEEVKQKDLHYERRDIIAALEKALAEAMSAAGYQVMNKVNSKAALDSDLFEKVLGKFETAFPELGKKEGKK